MFTYCIEKQKQMIERFNAFATPEMKYHQLIALGKNLPSLDPKDRNKENLVSGCQSIIYLHSALKEGVVHFSAYSEALISAGLAAVLIEVYNGETPETILKCPPDYLETLGLRASLTPSRANGLYNIHLRMKQDALKFLMKKQ